MSRFRLIISFAIIASTLFMCGCVTDGRPSATPYDVSLPGTTSIPPAQSPGMDAANLPEPVTRFRAACMEYLNLREAPSPDAKAIGKVYKGAEVELLGYQEKFAHIRDARSGMEGYILAGYLVPDEGALGLEIVKPVLAYTYERMLEDIEALRKRYPERVRVESMGKSSEGRDIPVVIIGDSSAERHLFIQAAIHAREHMTAQLAVSQIEYYLKYQYDETACVHVAPMTNPDGCAISQRGVYTDKLRDIYEKDQERGFADDSGAEYLYRWKANANGVDLNRNFDAKWDSVRTRPAASSANYRGPRPESEPETLALVNYTKRNSFGATISYHAFGSLIYYEFGQNSPTNEMSRKLALVISAITGYPVEGDTGTSFGGYKDWAIQAMGIPSLTVEIGTRSAPLPVEEFYTIFLRNREVIPEALMWLKRTEAQ